MEARENTIRECPLCGRRYTGTPALSRIDNSTKICPDCGTREALVSIGVSLNEQDRILAAIHRSMQP